MCRKLFFLVSLLAVLGLAGNALAVSKTFDNGEGNNLWSEPNNWNPDGVPGEGDVADIANGLGDANACLIDSTVVAVVGDVSTSYWNGVDFGVAISPGGNETGQLNMTGGRLLVTDGMTLLGTTAGCYGLFNMSGGTLDTLGGPGAHFVLGFAWHDNTPVADVYITGGEINAGGWLVCNWVDQEGISTLHLDGGELNIGGSATISLNGQVDITGGVMTIAQDMARINAGIANGRITAYGGNPLATLHVDLDTPTPGRVTLWAELSNAAAASNPSPANNSDGLTRAPTLSWTPGVGAPSHTVYVGESPTTLAVLTGQPQAANSVALSDLDYGTQYYWRVDEGAEVGPVWTFTTLDYDVVDDFEDYNDVTIAAAWGADANSSASVANNGVLGMRVEYDGATSVSKTTADADLTAGGATALQFSIRGEGTNDKTDVSVTLDDGANSFTLNIEDNNDTQESFYHDEIFALSDFTGVDVTSIDSITISIASGVGILNIDDIRIYADRCFNTEGYALTADLSGDCQINFEDFGIQAANWLNTGLSAAP